MRHGSRSPCLCLTCLAWRKASETLQLDERLPMIIDKLARPLAPSKILFQSVVTTLDLRCVTRGVTLALPFVAFVGARQRVLPLQKYRCGFALEELTTGHDNGDTCQA